MKNYSLYLTDEDHKNLKVLAAEHSVSMKAIIMLALRYFIDADSGEKTHILEQIGEVNEKG